MKIEKLDSEMLGTFALEECFAGGVVEIKNKEQRWVAVKTEIGWTIYYADLDRTQQEVIASGQKLHNNKNIKSLVPCTKMVLGLYHY